MRAWSLGVVLALTLAGCAVRGDLSPPARLDAIRVWSDVELALNQSEGSSGGQPDPPFLLFVQNATTPVTVPKGAAILYVAGVDGLYRVLHHPGDFRVEWQWRQECTVLHRSPHGNSSTTQPFFVTDGDVTGSAPYDEVSMSGSCQGDIIATWVPPLNATAS